MSRVIELVSGPFHDIFDEKHTFNGKLERIVLEFTVKRQEPGPGMAFAGAATPQSFDYMPIAYKAFETPKKVLFWKTGGLVAFCLTNMGPWTFDGKLLRPEELVDFVVSEAKSLAERYAVPVEIIYHGDNVYAKKYLQPKQQKQQQT